MARKSGFVRRNGVMRRDTFWIGGTFTRTALAAGAAVLTQSMSITQVPYTIIRTRGMVGFKSDQLVAGEPQQMAYGQAVVSV